MTIATLKSDLNEILACVEIREQQGGFDPHTSSVLQDPCIARAPFQVGYPYLCQKISDSYAGDIPLSLQIITALQDRIRLTCAFRTTIYDTYQDPNGAAAVARLDADFRLCALFAQAADTANNIAHEFDHKKDKNLQYDLRQGQVHAANATTQNMIHALTSKIQTKDIQEIDALKPLPDITADTALCAFHTATQAAGTHILTLARSYLDRIDLGLAFHHYCNAVSFPDDPALTQQVRVIGNKGLQIKQNALQNLTALSSEMGDILALFDQGTVHPLP